MPRAPKPTRRGVDRSERQALHAYSGEYYERDNGRGRHTQLDKEKKRPAGGEPRGRGTIEGRTTHTQGLHFFVLLLWREGGGGGRGATYRHIGDGDEVAADIPQRGQQLGEGRHDQIIAVSEELTKYQRGCVPRVSKFIYLKPAMPIFRPVILSRREGCGARPTTAAASRQRPAPRAASSPSTCNLPTRVPPFGPRKTVPRGKMDGRAKMS